MNTEVGIERVRPGSQAHSLTNILDPQNSNSSVSYFSLAVIKHHGHSLQKEGLIWAYGSGGMRVHTSIERQDSRHAQWLGQQAEG